MVRWQERFILGYRTAEIALAVIAVLFVGVNGLGLALAREGSWRAAHWGAIGVWVILLGGMVAIFNRFLSRHDPLLLPLIGLMMGWGILLIARLAPAFLWRHLLWVTLGGVALTLTAILPANLSYLRQYRTIWLVAGLLLLGLTLFFGVNPSGFGAALWLRIPLLPDVYFQPSEALKLLALIFFASYFDGRERLLQVGRSRFSLPDALPYLAPLLLMWGFCLILLTLQQDLGAATLFFVAFLVLLYVATGEKIYVVAGMLLLLIAGIFAYFQFDLVRLRIDAWWNPWPEATDRAYQIVQSLYALAAGGIWGQGIYQGFPEYIPVVHSDFVFAAVGEEWGLFGALGLVACFLTLTYRGLRIALLAKRPFLMYLSVGISTLFAAQTLLIMGGVTKLLPLTGVTLPFLSYGGSSMFVSCIMGGLLLHISGETERIGI